MRPVISMVALFGLLTLLSGCNSGRYPVNGLVHYADGTPVDSGTVIAETTIEGKAVGLQGNIEKDGTFKLGGVAPGDGALPGSYRAIVMPVALGDSEIAAGKTPSVEGKYSRFDSSGITFEVKAEPNKIDIQVSKPKSK